MEVHGHCSLTAHVVMRPKAASACTARDVKKEWPHTCVLEVDPARKPTCCKGGGGSFEGDGLFEATATPSRNRNNADAVGKRASESGGYGYKVFAASMRVIFAG